jgi:hypothetical protein
MPNPLLQSLRLSLAAGTVAVIAACADQAPLGPNRPASAPVQFATLPGTDTEGMISTLQRVTARYHDLNVARDDDFVLLHQCESRPGEGPVGIVYVNVARLMDGIVDPHSPDALIYEPGRDGRPKLVGVEFAVPYSPGTPPPQFLGATFQYEEEFGVYALHAWVWRHNPNGLFAETNPRVSCAAE